MAKEEIEVSMHSAKEASSIKTTFSLEYVSTTIISFSIDQDSQGTMTSIEKSKEKK